MERKIARPLKLKVHQAAAGIYDIVNSKMSDLIRRQVVRTGYLPDEFVIYAFGGAGPVHAAGFAAELGVKKIYIFAASPVFSAFGAAAADVVHTRVMTCQYILPADPAVVNRRLEAIEAEMKRIMSGEGFGGGQTGFQRFFTMRYRRQTAGVELPVGWDRLNPERGAKLQGIFEKKYEELYGGGAGYTKAGIEISAIRVDAVGRVAKPRLKAQRNKKAAAASAKKGKRKIYFTRPTGRFVDAEVYDYSLLGDGARIKGPAVIELPFTTALVPPAFRVTVDEYRNLVMERG
jgi:N-methylhydantoinase A